MIVGIGLDIVTTHEPGLAPAVVILAGVRTRAASEIPRPRIGTTWTLETVSSDAW